MSIDNDWNKVLLETQKKYWDSWMDWSRTATQAAQPTPRPSGFPPGVDEWFKMVSPNLQGEGADFYRRTFESGRGFFDMGQMFFGLSRDLQQAGEAWKAALDQNMAAWKESMTMEPSSMTDAWSAYAGNWGLNGGAWGEFMKSLGQSPVDASDLMGVNAAEAWQRMMKVPALGYGRESQEQMQQWGLLAGQSAQAMQDYAVLLNEANGQAVDLMQKRLGEMIAKGETPDSIRGLYDLWVDCGESSYSKLSSDERFLKAQGALMNSMMALKKHENEMSQDLLSSLNIPNRRELDTALRRLHDVRADLLDLKDLVDDSGVDSLHKQLSELRDQVRILNEQQAAMAEKLAAAEAKPVAPAAAAAKPVAKKPTATRRKPAAKKNTAVPRTTRAATEPKEE